MRQSRTSKLIERFTHHEDKVWQAASERLGGEFIGEKGWSQDCIRIKEGPWTVTIDLHSHVAYKSQVVYTRIRAPFVNPEKFRFEIYKQGFGEEIQKLFGMQDVEVGDESFDKMFILKATEEQRLQMMLDDGKLRKLFMQEPNIHVALCRSDDWFQEEHPDGVDELKLEVAGEVNDITRLKRLFDTFSRMLRDLTHRGSAYFDPASTDG